MPYKLERQIKNSKDQSPVPFKISVDGSIANSIARIFNAVCRLIEGVVDWLIWKLQKNMQK